jgi:hypothetical protein
MKHTKSTTSSSSSTIKLENFKNSSKIDTPNTHICSLTVLAQTSYERDGVNLMLWTLT